MSQEYRQGTNRPAGGFVGPVIQGAQDGSGTVTPVAVSNRGELLTVPVDLLDISRAMLVELRLIRRGLEMVLNLDLTEET